jgi:ABC-type multidrug transport system fused ATPase/permease subunit
MSDSSYENSPVAETNGNFTLENAKNTAVNTAQSAMASIQNSQGYQNVKDTVQNGPVAQNVKAETAKTRSEFADLANARQTPDQPAATGQPLTHYHSMFYRLLSWKNPRATSISFAVSVLFIFATRYLNILRWIFKGLYLILGVTAGAEIVGKTVMGNGFTSQMRPRKYFVIPKASLERLLDDVEQLINFFVIEFQRIVFAENVYVTGAAFFAAFISYYLIKFLPLWGLSLIATTLVYLAPLVYIQNKEVIDAQLNRAGDAVSQQASQLKDIAAQHTGKASETLRAYTEEYSHKAQDLIGSARRRSASPNSIKKEDFPAAPVQEPVNGTTTGRVPVVETL